MKQKKIRLAVDALKECGKFVFLSNKDICFYTNELTENNLFHSKKYNKLKGIQPVVLSRALSGRLSQKKEDQVLDVLEAILIEYFGYAYDEERNDFVFISDPKRTFPELLEKEVGLGSGLRFFNKIPSDEIKSEVRVAKRIFIIQSLLAGWGKMEETFKEAIERGCDEIQILLVKPFSEAAYTRGKSLQHHPVQLIDDLIKSSIIKITRIVNLLKEEHKEVIKLRFYDSSPVTPMFWLINEEGGEDIFWGFYFYGKTALSTPWFRLRNSRLNLSENLKSHFKGLWSSAVDVPLTGEAFKSYVDILEEASKLKCFVSVIKRKEEIVFFKVFYFRNNEKVSFRLKIDVGNEKVEIDNTVSGVAYSGIMKTQGNNTHLIAHTEFGAGPRILHLLLYGGGAKIDHKDSFFGFFINVSHEFGIPHTNGVLIKKYNPMIQPYDDVTLDNRKEDKILSSLVQNIPKQFIIPWDKEKKETHADYLFYTACYFAGKGEVEKGEELLRKAVHSGFSNEAIFLKEEKAGTFKNFNLKKILYIKEYFE